MMLRRKQTIDNRETDGINEKTFDKMSVSPVFVFFVLFVIILQSISTPTVEYGILHER